MMNEHLQRVFEILLPELEREEIEYWVYGGVSRAALVGRFMHHNRDVDIFVKEPDFECAKLVLDDLRNRYEFTLNTCRPLKNGRPKFEVIDNEKREILSVVPVYVKDGVVEFRFEKRPAPYPYQILEGTARNISGWSFFTPPDEYVKELFKTYLTSKPVVKKREQIRIDAKEILTPDEFRAFFRD